MLGLHKFGPIVDVEKAKAPYGNTRRLVTSFDVKGRMIHHNGVKPGSFAMKNKDGKYVHEAVWEYLFLHPVDHVASSDCFAPAIHSPASRRSTGPGPIVCCLNVSSLTPWYEVRPLKVQPHGFSANWVIFWDSYW
jgi:hypothetical protein